MQQHGVTEKAKNIELQVSDSLSDLKQDRCPVEWCQEEFESPIDYARHKAIHHRADSTNGVHEYRKSSSRKHARSPVYPAASRYTEFDQHYPARPYKRYRRKFIGEIDELVETPVKRSKIMSIEDARKRFLPLINKLKAKFSTKSPGQCSHPMIGCLRMYIEYKYYCIEKKKK
eukprot:TRINITY_DN4659_c0_g1_i1.p1 TRINITY_DN4659_c0_g1~~TRINITY_DN4659_c0_g1_i1.p1  ORF type:complete len:200 (-),score=17.77 TRINITY_DN4659_c0_g1_i1:22-540(-)